jgi:transglutaminase-like putative cysteine protease
VGYRNPSSYRVTFLARLSPATYVLSPDDIGRYDTSSIEYGRYTHPSTRIESDNPGIIQLAREIVGGETNPYREAGLIHEWVSTNIAGQGEDGETATSTLAKRSGSCGGHSFLFVALLRSLGIPARDVGGIRAGDQGYFPDVSTWGKNLRIHIWSEFFLPAYGWIQSDTSAGKENFAGISETRVVLFRGEDIKLLHDYPLVTVPWFHMPQVERIGNGDPKTQVVGDELMLTAQVLP